MAFTKRDGNELVTILYHGTYAADYIREHGFSHAGDPEVQSKYGTPWVSLTDNKDYADSIGDETIAVDISNLSIMTADQAEDGPADLHEFVAWVRAQGFDAFEHPQEAEEIGVVNLDKIQITEGS